MQELINISNEVTMSSIDLVKLINDMREDDSKSELRHDTFMAKIKKISAEVGIQFKMDTYVNQQNKQTYPCARLNSRLAKLMVMSESVKVQLAVLDRVTELENENNKQSAMLPQTYIDALKALVVAEEQKELLRIENSKLNTLLDREFGYVSTIRAAKFIGCHENYFNWRSLKAMTKSLGMECKRVPSPRFEYMNLYPIRAFELCYPELDFDDLKPELIDDKQSLAFSNGEIDKNNLTSKN